MRIIDGLICKISEYFQFDKHNTTFRVEILAGISSFLALSYIFVVNPAILSQGGMNMSAVLFATIVASALGTILMGVWAKKPFVLAPGLEMNAWVVFFVIGTLGAVWQDALGAVFWSGIICVILAMSGIRTKVINAIPDKMKTGLALSVGVFLMLVALKLSGVLIYEGVEIKGIGALLAPPAYVLAFGLVCILVLRKLKVRGAMLISIALASVLAQIIMPVIASDPATTATSATTTAVSIDMLSAIMKFNPFVILKPEMFGVILVLFLIDFYGSIAKFIGLTRNTSIVDKDGTMPQMKEALAVDGLATVGGAMLGTTSLITYVESAVGIGEGGRTGFTAVVCGIVMLGFFLLTPIVNLVPLIATTGALLWVGLDLFPSAKELKTYAKLDLAMIAAMLVMVVWSFSFSRAMLAGFALFIIGSILSGRTRDINKYMVISALLLLIGVILSP